MKIRIKECKHGLFFLLFILIEVLYFLTQLRDIDYNLVHVSLDDMIPFLPIFVIPYVAWYVYVPGGMLYNFFVDKNAFRKQILTVVSGMAISIIVFCIYPTTIDFRPSAEGDGFFLWICRLLFSNDKPVNVLPSMHCFEAVIIHLTAFKNEKLRRYIPLRISSAVLSLLICLSTVFIKQHSVVDLVSGVALAYLLYFIVYILPETVKKKKRANI
ncbi:MAG: phosphatase PAP2 family protein [Clostridia bacterium]|nr:phosphatase PAP2 family protein [Clostridia bacterium]